MNAHLDILFMATLALLPVIGLGRWVVVSARRLRRASQTPPPASMWKRAASVEPHLRPPVNGMVLRQVAIHVARRHHAPLPKEPGKLWR